MDALFWFGRPHGGARLIGAAALAFGLWLPAAEAAVAFKSSSTARVPLTNGNAGGTSLTIDKPTSPALAAGDVCVATLGIRSSSATLNLTAHSDWTLIDSGTHTNVTLASYYRVIDGSEGASWAFSWSSSITAGAAGAIVCYTGVDTTAPIDASSFTNGTNTTTPTAPDVTTTVDGDKIIRLFVADDDTSNGNPPAATDERYIVNVNPSGVSNDLSFGYADADQVSAGSTGSAAFSLGANEDWRAGTIALKAYVPPVPGEVSGTVFRDYNADGIQDGGEPVIVGVTVTAYDGNGNSASTVTGATGAYTISAANGSPATLTGTLRLEFTLPGDGSLDFLKPGTAGGTSVQFADIAAGALDVDAGFANPAQYVASTNPKLTTSFFGDTSNDAAGTRSALASFNWADTGTTPTPATEALQNQIGATWGLAYQRSSDSLFAAAYQKRHSGYGPNGTGAIYRVTNPADGATTGVSLFVDLNVLFGSSVAGTNPHPTGTNFEIDASSWDAVGKVAFGDMDIAEDELSLWAVNMADRQLYRIPLGTDPANPVAPTSSAQVSRYPLASAGSPLPNLPSQCADNDDIRPFGVGVRDGLVYVGLVCSAETSGSVANLRGLIYSFDPDTTTFAKVLDFPLDFNRGCAMDLNTTCTDGSPSGNTANWNAWEPTYSTSIFSYQYASANGDEVGLPQPMLSDIDFSEDGSIIIGMRDRFGDQFGFRQRDPLGNFDNSGGQPWRADGSGDILRATPDGAGGWTFSTVAATNGTEFFAGDDYQGSADHYEVSNGGVAVLTGTGELAVTVFDPVTAAFAAGVHWMNTGTGARTDRYQLYAEASGTSDTGRFGKSNGLGDLEILADPAPIEIGNRIWNDADRDGVQDGNEVPIAGVVVGVYSAAGTLIDTVTTDSDGTYVFSNAAGSDTTGRNYGVAELVPGGTFTVAVLESNFSTGGALEGKLKTTANSAASGADTSNDALTDVRDSDGLTLASAVGSGADAADWGLSITLGGAGSNNHGLDFGVYDAVAIGNRVWLDDGTGGGTANDGIQNGGETGIDGVVVNLYTSLGVYVATTTTDASGNYWFDDLLAGSYYVEIPASEFDSGGPLFSTRSSNGDGGDDGIDQTLDENGIDDANPQANGIRSDAFDLTVGGEPTGESQAGYAGLLPDANVNGTDDFGFVPRVAIGNRVWLDNGAGGGGLNNGLQDGGELGIANVTVELYTGAGVLVTSTTTDGTGHYQFDNLLPGNYYTRIPAAEFQAGGDLIGYLGSGGADAGELTDLDDNGIDNAAPATNGINSNTFTLTLGGEPTGEVSQVAYTGSLPDSSVNFTDDFGFYSPAASYVAIGNRVWRDDGAGAGNADDGLMSGSEAGIDGVIVELYTGAGTLVTSTVTANGGYYYFDSLLPGDYYTKIPATEFGAGEPLARLINSTDEVGPGPNEVDDQTVDENGIDDPAYLVNGIRSNTFTLSLGGERTGEDQGTYPGVLPDASVNATNDFGFYPPVSIGSTLFYDDNDNGLQDGGEGGIAGVTVELYSSGATPGVNTPLATTTTDGSGNYFFDNLAPGTYRVNVPTPPASAPKSSSPAVTDLNDNDEDGDDNGIQLTPGGNVYSGLVVLDNDAEATNGVETFQGGTQDDADDDNGNMTVDFGFVPVVSLGSTVFGDSNDNGVQDGAETGLSGVGVELYLSTQTPGVDTPVASDTTDGNGDYYFGGLQPGSYVVYIPTPPASAPSSSSATDTADNGVDGNDNGSQGASGQPVTSPVIVLTVDGETSTEPSQGGTQDDADDNNGDMTVDFGFVPTAGLVSLGSTVFGDSNDNGVQDGAETGLSGVGVQLYLSTQTPGVDTPVASDTTDGNGDYFFGGLQPGSYVVYIPTPPASAPTSSSVTDAADNGVDGNDNGSQGASGQPVTSPVIVLTVDGETSTEPSQGGTQDDTDDNNGDMTVDFGFVPTGYSIGSYVWRDANRDGIQDATEAQLAGVQVALLDDNGDQALDLGGSPVPAQTTGADGLYYFGNLAAGDYLVQVTPPAGYEPSPVQSTGGIVGGTNTNVAADDSNLDLESSPGVYLSGIITLGAGNEPVEAGGFAGDDQDTGDDTAGNMTVDFGFVAYDLALRKTVASLSHSPLIPGLSTVTFVIEVFNQGDVAASDVVIADYVQTGFDYEQADNTAVLTGNANDWGVGPNPTLLIPGPIPAGGSVQATLVLRVASGTAGQELQNLSEIQGSDGGAYTDIDSTPDGTQANDVLVDDVIDNTGGDEDDHDVAKVQVDVFDLALRKTFESVSQTPPVPGSSLVTFAIEVFNQGDLQADNVTIVDYVPVGFTFNALDNTAALTGNANAWVAGTNGPELLVGSLSPSASVTVRIRLRLDAGTEGQTLVNTAEIAEDGEAIGSDIDSTPDDLSGNEAGPVKDDVIDEDAKANPGADDEDDHDVAPFTVNAFDLALRKQVGVLSDDPLIPGTSTVTFTIEVINQGQVEATDVEIVDYLQAGLTFDPAKNLTWTPSAAGPKTLIPGPIPAMGSTTVQIVLDVAPGTYGQTLENYAEISDDGQAPGSDVDSTPDDTDGETPVKDDVIDEDAKTKPGVDDEDDHDLAEVLVADRVAIGNLIFFDKDDDGAYEPLAGETGVPAGVVVRLYQAGKVPGVDAAYASTSTGVGGTYVFDLLPEGAYFVHIPASEFQTGRPLLGHDSSTGQGGDDTQDQSQDENGGDGTLPSTQGVSTNVFDLRAGTEPSADDQTGYTGPLVNANVNFTADLGFYKEVLTCTQICDINSDSKVNKTDLTLISRRRGTKVTPPGAANSGDCNLDGVLSINDVRACTPFQTP